MLFEGGMHPDLKKFLRRDDSQRRNASGFDEIPGTQNAAVSAGQNSIRNCQDRRFLKQNTILRFHFRNKTQDRSFISETKHHCIQEQVF